MSHPNTKSVNIAHNLRPNPSQAHQVLMPSATAAPIMSLAGYALDSKTQYVAWAVEGGDVRMTSDNTTAPTATVGFKCVDGFSGLVSADEWRVMRVIVLAGEPVIQMQGYSV